MHCIINLIDEPCRIRIAKWLQELLDDVVLLWRNPTLNCDTIDPFIEVLVEDWSLSVIDLEIMLL